MVPVFAEPEGVCFPNRFTVATPFIEDENQRDMKIRISGRTINWGILDQVGLSPQGTLSSFNRVFHTR